MQLIPQDKISFGKHRGHLLSDVYKFAPTYLNWAIQFVQQFIIDIEKFNVLPIPTPYVERVPLTINGITLDGGMNPTKSSINAGLELIKKGEVIDEENFVFPEQIVIINELKLKCRYNTPVYDPKKSGVDLKRLLNDDPDEIAKSEWLRKLKDQDRWFCKICGGDYLYGCLLNNISLCTGKERKFINQLAI